MKQREGEGTKFTIDRKIFSSDIWFASPWKLKVWIYLLGHANHKSTTWKGIELKRGQLIRSYRRIQKDCAYKIGYRTKKPSLHTIARICEELTKERRMTLRKEHGGQVITICNYDKMQLTPKHERNDERNDRGTLPEQDNNVNNGFIKILLKNQTEWTPDKAYLEELKRLFPSVNLENEFRSMEAWCLNNPDRRKTARGIKRFIGNWLQGAQQKAEGENPSRPRQRIVKAGDPELIAND